MHFWSLVHRQSTSLSLPLSLFSLPSLSSLSLQTYRSTHLCFYISTPISTHRHVHMILITRYVYIWMPPVYISVCRCLYCCIYTCICLCTYIHIYMSVYLCIHPLIHTCAHLYIHASVYPYIHISIHPCVHTCGHALPYVHASIQSYMPHTPIHSFILTSVHP